MSTIFSSDEAFTTLAADLAPCQSPMWRFVATDLESNVTTILDRVAADRHVEPLLNVPNWLSFTVPSDSPLVYIPYTGDAGTDPYVAEGNRLVYAFRQESNVAPYFVCRGAGTILQAEDTAEQDNARTRLVAYDPWKLAERRPAQDASGNLPAPMGTWDGVYSPGTEVGDIIQDQLNNTIANNGPLRIVVGTVETTAAWSSTEPYTVQQGMSVADVWTAMVNTAKCDIVLTPIFDPITNPGVTHELNIYAQAGAELPDAIFGWDRPPHSLVQLSRVIDGNSRANKVKLAAGQGGSGGYTTLKTDATSVTKYGQYWAQQFFPNVISPDGLDALATFQLGLRKNGRITVQMSPTPERSPCPFIEYNVGDRVPVYASGDRFRQELAGYVRIYGFPIDISDDALEKVERMILLPEAA